MTRKAYPAEQFIDKLCQPAGLPTEAEIAEGATSA